MTTISPGQLVRLSHCDQRSLVGKVVHIIPNSEPRPLSKDYVAVVRVGGEREFLRRLSELRPLCDRTEQIIACGDVIG